MEELDLGPSHENAIALSPDGKRLLSSHGDQQVRLWDIAAQKELCAFPTTDVSKVHHLTLAFSADGQYACAGGWPGLVYVWRLPRP